ncbi:hypothetical protein GGS23DRAFT_259205 [Durotheca rogersii]|uniref:uncharacterized protein n=1 Tax=Durotheca rogersii TaxID=419775 RepID=UPI00221EB29C|nr:uncharacterized protein GGS23DRAFT_259205 [Durotheca rogersii]KAI5860023.1 hypothetical protein GGS23DRAFT_259205 [Durotheca rogersii]
MSTVDFQQLVPSQIPSMFGVESRIIHAACRASARMARSWLHGLSVYLPPTRSWLFLFLGHYSRGPRTIFICLPNLLHTRVYTYIRACVPLRFRLGAGRAAGGVISHQEAAGRPPSHVGGTVRLVAVRSITTRQAGFGRRLRIYDGCGCRGLRANTRQLPPPPPSSVLLTLLSTFPSAYLAHCELDAFFTFIFRGRPVFNLRRRHAHGRIVVTG